MRRFTALFGVACIGLVWLPGSPAVRVAAAPVPTHLMPKDAPLAHPTAVGATWVYETNQGRDRTRRISKVEEKDGAKVVTTEYCDPDGNWKHDVTHAVSAKGVFLLREEGRDYAEPWCILKLPHKPGETWKSRGDEMTAGAVEEIDTPAGKIKACLVEWEHAPGRRAKYWYAHGLGLVRRDADFNLSLKSFTPAKE